MYMYKAWPQGKYKEIEPHFEAEAQVGNSKRKSVYGEMRS
jgi:hypothetical protein